jgi:hypothetical protein
VWTIAAPDAGPDSATGGQERLRLAEQRLMPPDLPFDPTDPPAEPPPGCLDRQRWRLAYQMFTAHQGEDGGSRCQVCGEVWPCGGHKRAVHGLVTACLQVGAIKVSGAVGPEDSELCRWCGRGIARHPLYGWVHQVSGLLVCEKSPEGGAVVTVAEPVTSPST